jgi:APA family basic amino acid/polyamine antiporter
MMVELHRHLGLFHTIMYGVGLILGAGIYALIGDAAGQAGNSLWLSFVLGAFAAVFTGLSYAELSSMYPRAAAEYIFVKNAFRSNFVAFIVGWLTLFVAIISASAIALGFGGYFTTISGMPIVVAALGHNWVVFFEFFWHSRIIFTKYRVHNSRGSRPCPCDLARPRHF